jgi:quinol monooxygenase YgiN
MRRRDDGWDDGRRDWGGEGGWPDGAARDSYGGDRGGDGRGNGQSQGYGRPDYQAYPGPGAGEMTRVDAGFGDPAANGRGYSGDGYGQQANFTPSFTPSGAPAEFSPGEASAPDRSGARRPYGRLSIFTLLDDKTAEFDRLAEEAAEGVRASEPDTLVYVIHVVPKAPMQRIIYEIYRDRAAFENHESQPHIARFTEARKSCVLATNIIDLRLKYAKVAALFQGDQQAGRRVDADDDLGVPAGGAAGARRPHPPLPALEAGPAAAGGDGYFGGQPAAGQYAGAQPGAAQYGSGQYGSAQYGSAQNGGAQNGGAQNGGAQYDGTQYGGAQYADARYGGGYGADQYAGGQSGQAQSANGQHGNAQHGNAQYGNAQYGSAQYGGAYGQNGQNGQYNGAGQNGQYNGAGQNGQYNGAAQNGQYNGPGQNGQYNGAGQYQGYGENGGYRGAAGPGPGAGQDSQPAGRPPWEDAPDWTPSDYSAQRYRD